MKTQSKKIDDLEIMVISRTTEESDNGILTDCLVSKEPSRQQIRKLLRTYKTITILNKPIISLRNLEKNKINLFTF